MQSLFDSLQDLTPHPTWTPEPPPPLDNVRDVFLNVESTGLRWWEDDRPIGITVGRPDGFKRYLPFGHRPGGNLDEVQVKEWARRELRGKRITNINTRFDVHMLREWGVDLEAQDNEVSDIGHYAALLDDHRQLLSLDSLIPDYLHETPLPRVNEARMADYHAGDVAPRAEYNVDAVRRLKDEMWPQLDAQDLQRVRALEDQVIYVVCEMEKNGAPIDIELLDRYIVESQRKLEEYLWRVSRAVGFSVNPGSPKDMERVFKQLNIPIERTAPTLKHPYGSPSFTDEILKRIDHATVQDIRKAGKLISLRSKYLLKYKRNVDSKGILRYALHQLRATKDEFADDEGKAGTTTGRFSSSEIVRGVGINVQQEMKVEKQRVAFGFDEDDASHDDEIFIIRQLRIPDRSACVDAEWLSADANQIEYRIFAHFANNREIIKAYEQNPDLKFHHHIHAMLKPRLPELTYRRCKDCNFAKVYGAKLKKLALMLGYITKSQWQMLRDTHAPDSHPLLKEAREVQAIYDQELPEVNRLLKEAMHLAKPECDSYCRPNDWLHRRLEHRGYVKTILGRRGRFPDGERLHKAFNTVDQGTGADIMKTKLVELHRERKHTNLLLRYTVHDEVDGDARTPETALRVKEILDTQSFKLRVPITWDVTTGDNWAACAA